MRTLAGVAAVAGVVTLVACGSSAGAPDAPASSPAPSSPAPSSPAPSPSTEVDCGEVVLNQGEVLEVTGARQRSCLERALRDGRSATLSVRAPTTEGDPIVTRWTLSADRTLTGDVDATRDRFAGDARSYRVSCGSVTDLPSPLVCDADGS